MTGLDLMRINRIWHEAIEKKNQRIKLHDCPYPVMQYNSTSGTLKTEKIECKDGPGAQCAMCSRHTRWQAQQGASKEVYCRKKKHILDSYNKTGLVPYLRHKPSPDRVVNPGGML